MKNKITFFVLTVLMVFSIFLFGCNNQNGTNQSNGDITSNSDSSSDDDPVFGGFKAKPGDIDFGGKTVIISHWSGESGPVKLADDNSNKEAYTRVKMAEEKYNLTFEMKVIVGEAYSEQFAASAAAGIKFADIVNAPTIWAFPSWIKNGFFSPLDDVLDYSHERYEVQSNFSKWVDGKHYFIVTPIIYPPAVAYNPDILEREGCPDPVTLAQEGNWTWDAFRDIAVRCTKNTNSANPQYGLKGWFVPQLLHSNGVSQIKIEENKLTSGLFDESCLNALNFYHDLLITKRVIDPATWQIGNANFVNGTVAMTVGELYSFANLRDTMSNFRIVPIPKGPDVDEYVALSSNIPFVAYSPLSDFDLSQLVAVHRYASSTDDKSNSETYIDTFKKFKENSEKAKYFSSDEEINLYWDTMQGAIAQFAPAIDANIMWRYIISQTSNISTGESPATVLETMRNEVLADIENQMK